MNGTEQWKRVGLFVLFVLVLGLFKATRTAALWVAGIGALLIIAAYIQKKGLP